MSSPATTATRCAALLAATALAACSSAPSAEQVMGEQVARAESTITAEAIRAGIAFLASDQLRGRDTPSPGLDTAAAWIARELAASGIQPGAGDGSWIQAFPYPLEGLDTREARLEISGGATHTLEYGEDFYAEAGVAPERGVGVVHLGSAAALERLGGGELRDRAILLSLSAEPEEGRRGLGLPWDARRTVAAARALARDAGAASVVFVLPEGVTPEEVSALAGTAATPGRVAGGRAADTEPAAFFITRPAALRLYRMAGLDGAELLRRADFIHPVPLPGLTLRLAAPTRALDDARAPNVVGVLPGSDPALRDQYVVLTAHMDHVGVGRPVDGDSIYNGADDDASGTAAVLAVARALAALPTPPRRSVLFLFVSGEEKGLLGSRWYVENPTVPLDAIVANLNLDMVGRNAPDSIVVIGQEYSTLGDLVLDVARKSPDLGLTVAPDPWPEEQFFFRSDHFSFAAREIPALFFFAGTHEDYHRPGDEVEDIDADKNARVARLVFLLAHRIAQADAAPEWYPQGLDEVRRLTDGRD